MSASLLDPIRRSGLIAVIRNHASLDVLLEVGDALLASPLTVVAISTRSREPGTAIAELRARFGRNMLVGAANFASHPQTAKRTAAVQQAIDAGAQFVLGDCFHPTTAALCNRNACAYLPRIGAVDELAQAANAGCPAVVVFPAQRAGVIRCHNYVLATRSHPAGPGVIAAGGIAPGALPAYARSGADAAVVYGVLGAGAAWSMPGFIRRVRRLRTAWSASVEDEDAHHST